MIQWRAASCENLADPDRVAALLARAIAAAPGQATPHLKLADIYLDRNAFARAARELETALHHDASLMAARVRLARCYNLERRFQDALSLLAGATGEDRAIAADAHHVRGVALLGLDRATQAEDAFRAALAADPRHWRACWQLCRELRTAGRLPEIRQLCTELAGKGVAHTRLLVEWGRALAFAGDLAGARRLLFDPARVARRSLSVPSGFSDIQAFNAAVAEELLANPHALRDFPEHEEANRGSSRIHLLLAGRRPDLIRLLMRALEREVEEHVLELESVGPPGELDRWRTARPRSAHQNAWALLQRGGEYEAWHTHPGGWLSVAYYVRVPAGIEAANDGRGCLEFGPPPSLAEALPDLIAPRRYPPQAGTLVLAPSHYHHRTIPTGSGEPRISFVFDVVPDDVRPAS